MIPSSIRFRSVLCFLSLTSVLSMSLLSDAAGAKEPQSFQAATRGPFSPPPNKSINGKTIESYKQAVEKSWDEIQFQKDGKAQTYSVTLDTDEGEIQIQFYPGEAPNHVKSFIGLAKAGFYDGLIFHRCIPGFMIQGGCPKGDGTGGPGYCVKQEFNSRRHTRGTLSMARARPKDSAGSQFFLCTSDALFLDNEYTVFGKVVKGMDVADRIVGRPRNAQDRPNNPVKIKKATVAVASAE